MHAPVCTHTFTRTHTCAHAAQATWNPLATASTLAPGLSQLRAVRNSTFWDVYKRDSSSPLNPFKKINMPPPQESQLSPAWALTSSGPRTSSYGLASPSGPGSPSSSSLCQEGPAPQLGGHREPWAAHPPSPQLRGSPRRHAWISCAQQAKLKRPTRSAVPSCLDKWALPQEGGPSPPQRERTGRTQARTQRVLKSQMSQTLQRLGSHGPRRGQLSRRPQSKGHPALQADCPQQAGPSHTRHLVHLDARRSDLLPALSVPRHPQAATLSPGETDAQVHPASGEARTRPEPQQPGISSGRPKENTSPAGVAGGWVVQTLSLAGSAARSEKGGGSRAMPPL